LLGLCKNGQNEIKQPSIMARINLVCTKTQFVQNVKSILSEPNCNTGQTVERIRKQSLCRFFVQGLCKQFNLGGATPRVLIRAGLRRGNGGNCSGPSAPRGPPWWNLFLL